MTGSVGKPNVLVVAYACEPHRGSESEVGWQWILAAARDGYKLTVVTRSNNQPKIAAAAAEWNDLELEFQFHEAPRLLLWMKSMATFPRLYYVAWQVSFIPRCLRLLRSGRFDLFHHLTYVSARFPSVLLIAGRRFVLGPIGGLGVVPRELRAVLTPAERLVELVRDCGAKVDRVNPLWRLSMNVCARVLVADRDTLDRLPPRVQDKCRVIPAIAVARESLRTAARDPSTRQIAMVGELTGRKGQSVALQALSLLDDLEWKCDVIGAGRGLRALLDEASRLGIDQRCNFAGSIPREELLEYLQGRPVVVALSLRESGGMALLEAAAAGCPVVYLEAGGPAQLFEGFPYGAVPVGDSEEVARMAASWIRSYLTDPVLAHDAGEAASHVASRLTWDNKVFALRWLYESEEFHT